MTWRGKRQLIALSVVALPFLIVAIWTIFLLSPEATCTDNRKNQGEVQIDCGGPCGPCELKHPKSLTLYWARVVKAKADSYDVAAEIENTNEVLSSGKINYEVLLMSGDVPVAIRRGSTYIFAQEKTHIIESNIETSRTPDGVDIKILTPEWVYRTDIKPNLVVDRREYKIEESEGKKQSVVEAIISNRTPLGFREVEVRVILLSKENNLVGVKKTVIDNLAPGQKQSVRLPWPEELEGEVTNIIVEPRVNVFESDAIMRP